MIMFIEKQYEAPLSNEVKREFNNLILLISKIPQYDRVRKKISGSTGNISVADLIAYQIGWGSLLLTWYGEGIKGKIPQMPGEGFKKWDYTALAKHFYKKYRYDGYKKQTQHFFNIVNRILSMIEKEYKTQNLDKLGVWSWCTLSSGKQWSLSKWVKVNTVSPYKRASMLIRKYIKLKKA